MKVFVRTLSKRVINFSFAIIVAFSTLTAVMPFILSEKASAITPRSTYNEEFTSGVGDWIDGTNGWYGSVTNEDGYAVAQMTNPTETGPFSKLGGYIGVWQGNYTVSTDVYLNSSWNDGVGFEYSVATNGRDGNHQRDFVFHIAKNPSTHQLWVAADNNASLVGGNYIVNTDLSGYGNKYQITGGGDWYIMKYTFRDNGGQLAVDMQLIRRSSGAVLFTETRSSAQDTIPAEVGGHRYAWFTAINNPMGIKFDNVSVIQDDYTPTGLNIKRDADSAVITGGVVKDTAHNLRWDEPLVAGSLYQVRVTDPDGVVKTWRSSTARFDLDRGSAYSGEFGMKQGVYTYEVRLQQAAPPYGAVTNWSDPVTLTYDSTAPVIENITLNRTPTNEDTLTVNGTVTDLNLKNYNLRVYKEDKSGQVSPGIAYTGTTEVSNGELAILNISNLSYGNYWVRIWADDLAGNRTGISSHIYVSFTIDNEPPTITVTGGDLTIEAGSSYAEQGATWTDTVDESGTVSDITGAVDTATPGVYTVTYSYIDAAGNPPGTATRTVTVVDTTDPDITLIGDATVTLTVGDTYTEQGAIWTDTVDTTGDAIVGGDVVDTTVAGTYVVTYNYTDAAGNPATEVTRIVTVEAADSTDGGEVLGEEDSKPSTEPSQESNIETTSDSEDQLVFQTVTTTQTGDDTDSDKAKSSVDTDSIASSTSGDEEVQGESSDKNAGDIFGLAWYWWLLILGALAAAIWWVVGLTRRQKEE